MTNPASSSSQPAWSATDLASNPHQTVDKSDRVQRMFAAISRSYDLNNRLHSFGRDQAWRRKTVRLAAVQSTDYVLDVACGTGDLTEAFADARPREVIGLDFTQPMLEIAGKKAARRRRPDGVPTPTYINGDAMRLPFADGRFDVLSIAFGIRNVRDVDQTLCEFRRVLRPGGRLAILEFDQPRNPLLRWGNAVYCRHIMPITATLISRDRSGAYRYLPRSVETFIDRESMARRLQKAGFEAVTSHPMTFGVCVCTLGHVPPPPIICAGGDSIAEKRGNATRLDGSCTYNRCR
jgi:demethylmenaquinone methyltransferase/2-methoxy-6-polyprenyl-1,4-benzoquinol methylase